MILDELESLGDKVVLISVLSPAHLDRLMWAETSIAAYGRGRESFRAAFAALAGDFVPEGRLPIPLRSAEAGKGGDSGDSADSAPGRAGAGRKAASASSGDSGDSAPGKGGAGRKGASAPSGASADSAAGKAGAGRGER